MSRVLGQRFSTEEAGARIRTFDKGWHGIVTSYTLCKLMEHTDKLMVISSIAHELASTQIPKKRYRAGLWDGWIAVEREKTPPRKGAEEEGYVAPSWGWASIGAPVSPNFI